MRSLPLFALLLALACGGGGDTETTEPATSETSTGSTDETATTPSAPDSAATFEVAECAQYGYTPTDCNGSPENPSCHDSFELRPDGRATKLFDDIVADGRYSIDGGQVTIEIPDFDYSETLTAEEDGAVLVSSTGARFTRSACD